ncbi:MAG: hypothetical protein IPH26_19395 [Sterolibacteriaceae bacterium]|uniref:Uncharacterized protein n=1 Tax=Candidatus Methylophosphatis roskildensis TaxID=2899263 RepID=A0A9D7E1Z4_9PROT|nr:hypothetical protein [Candidatus Methylophosphatis roskildensis]MBK7237324.1 hypothetical protein [Sterolibacteriaceae bacterium]
MTVPGRRRPFVSERGRAQSGGYAQTAAKLPWAAEPPHPDVLAGHGDNRCLAGVKPTDAQDEVATAVIGGGARKARLDRVRSPGEIDANRSNHRGIEK